MKKDEKKRPSRLVIISILIVLITFAIGTLLIYIPFTEKNKSLRAQILEERNRNLLIGEIRAIGKHLKIYEKRLPEGRGVSWLLGEISEMASDKQIEISSIKPGAPEDRGLYTKLYVVMDTISTYHQLGSFLSKVESSKKFLKVESINIKRLDSDASVAFDTERFKFFDVKATIIISAFVFKE